MEIFVSGSQVGEKRIIYLFSRAGPAMRPSGAVASGKIGRMCPSLPLSLPTLLLLVPEGGPDRKRKCGGKLG